MTLRNAFTAVLILALLWAGSVWWVGSGLESRLEARAVEALQGLEEASGAGRFDQVRVSFSGQQAILSGRVRSEMDAQRVYEEMGHHLRLTDGSALNPVAKVEVDPDFRIEAEPPGWLVVAVQGRRLQLLGVCASPGEKRVLETLVRSRWAHSEAELELEIHVDPRVHDESETMERTVDSLPESMGTRAVWLAGAPLGELLHELDSSQEPPQWEALPGVVASGVHRERLHQLVEGQRQAQLALRAWEQEQERLSKLPSAYAVLAVRGGQVLLRGEVYGKPQQRALVASVLAAFGDKQVLDDLKVSGRRRPTPGFATDLPTIKGSIWREGAVWMARGGEEWSRVEPDTLPAEGDLRGDGLFALNWASKDNAGIPTLGESLKVPFLTLAIYSGKVVLGGEVAGWSERDAVMAALKQAYGAGRVVVDRLRVGGHCLPTGSLEHTLRSLPDEDEGDSFLLAVAAAGRPWQVLGSDPDLLDPGQWQQVGLPETLTVARVLENLEEVLLELRAIQAQAEPNTTE